MKRYFANYDELFAKAGLDKLLEEGEDINSFLLRFAINNPGISSMIIGTKNADHLLQNVKNAKRVRLLPMFTKKRSSAWTRSASLPKHYKCEEK